MEQQQNECTIMKIDGEMMREGQRGGVANSLVAMYKHNAIGWMSCQSNYSFHH